MTQPSVSIRRVEHDTGLSKDTLRVWKRRYGFPSPARDSNGQRVYSSDQLEKLRVIKRLMDSGERPGKIVPATLSELHARLQLLSQADPAPTAQDAEIETAMRHIANNESTALHQHLAQALMRRGLRRFVEELVAPLNAAVGTAWMTGRIEVFQEHLYSEQIRTLLRQSIGTALQGGQAPRILLTTLPGEQHELGLLMAHACFTVEGAHCISLGLQTPVMDIARSAQAHRADIVGISCSLAMPVTRARAGIADLRRLLNESIDLWAGGGLWQRAPKSWPGVNTGVSTITSLGEIPAALAAWRENPVRANHQP